MKLPDLLNRNTGLNTTVRICFRPREGKENSTSGPGSSEGRPSLVPWFSRLLFLDVPGTATEQVRTCGFKRLLYQYQLQQHADYQLVITKGS